MLDTGGSRILSAGVYVKNGVVLNDAMRAFAKEFGRVAGLPILITSGIRTPRTQARALAQDYNFGVYSQKDLVDEIREGGLSIARMAATIENQMARGRYLSRHLRNDAIDLRVRGYTPEERAHIFSVAQQMGNAVDEGDHIHIGGITAQAAQTAQTAPAALGPQTFTIQRVLPRWFQPTMIGVFALGTLLSAVFLARRTRSRRRRRSR